jgi:carbamoyltransferase
VKERAAEDVPSISHVDKTTRPQTLKPGTNKHVYSMLKEFEELTGDGIVVNTSFNIHGEPLVETPVEALRSFKKGGFDAMYIQGWLVEKA